MSSSQTALPESVRGPDAQLPVGRIGRHGKAGAAAKRPSKPRSTNRRTPNRVALSLFWRTFFLLAVLLAGGVFAWTQTFRALEDEPRAAQAAQQIASLVNLARAVLTTVDGINRVALVKSMSDPGSIKLTPREPADRWTVYEKDRFTRATGEALRKRLGPDTLVASAVNGTPGLWVGFTLDKDPYWILANSSRLSSMATGTWLSWIGIALLATALGSAAVARLINQPLRDLSSATSRIRGGEYDSRLDETTLTSEIREVNMGFNRMARELAKVEEDRAVMLAGISHDLRTPLARLRLETEMSVQDEEARRYMVSDIAQLDAIIDKFMDYARPGQVKLMPVDLAALVEREMSNFREPNQIRIESRVSPQTIVLADETELSRVLQNLFENARRYGRNGDDQVARVEVSDARHGGGVTLTVRDHGSGVDPSKLHQLATPFYRGDVARTAATGAGLGLAIVDKAVQRMGGQLEMLNASGGGLLVNVRLRKAA